MNDGVVVFEDFDRAKLVLKRANSSSEDKLDVLAGLAKKAPSADIIASTGLGDILHSLSGHPDERVAAESTRIADYWRTCNQKKANRASIEVRCDARTQKLRDAARRMIQDSLKSTLKAQKGHRRRTEISSPAGVKRKRGVGSGEGDDTCESVAVRVDESLVSDVGCVVSQTSLGYSKGIRIDLDRYNSMIDSLDARGNSDSESSDEDDDVLFCNESHSQGDETFDSSRIGVELLRDIDSFLDSQIAKTKNVGGNDTCMTTNDKSLHGKDRILREGNNLQKVSSSDTKNILQNKGVAQNTIDESNRHKHCSNVSELKVKHCHANCKIIRASKKSVLHSPEELDKDAKEGISTDDGYVGSCGSQSSVENCAQKVEKLPSQAGTEFQSKERHRKRVKTETISSYSVGEDYSQSLCSANDNTNSVLLGPRKDSNGTLERQNSLRQNDIQEESCSNDVLVGDKSVKNALCETNLDEPHSKRRSSFSKEKSHKKSKKRSRDKPECQNLASLSGSNTTDECLRSRESKKHKKMHENHEISRIKDAGYTSTLDENINCEKFESCATNNKENSSDSCNDSIVEVAASGQFSLKASAIKVHQQQRRSTGEEISICNVEMKREVLGTTHEEHCTTSHCPTLKVGKGGSSAPPDGVSCSEGHNLAFKDEHCSDTMLCKLSPSTKTTCNATNKIFNSTNPVSLNDSTSAKQRPVENESNPYIIESSLTIDDPLNLATSTKEYSSIPRSEFSSLRKESRSYRKKSSSSRKESKSFKKDSRSNRMESNPSGTGSCSSRKQSSSSRKESSSCRKESSSSRKESSSSRKESSCSRKESSCSRKESSCSRKESSCSRDESSCSRKESSCSRKESSCSRKESSCSRKESSCSRKESSCSRKQSSSSHKDYMSSRKETSSSIKKCVTSLDETRFSRNKSTPSNKNSRSPGKEFSTVNEKLNSFKEDSSSSRELEYSSKESDSSRTQLNAVDTESDSSRNMSTASRKEFGFSEKESISSGKKPNTSRKENNTSKKKRRLSRDESSSSKTEKKSSSLQKDLNFHGEDANCSKKSSSCSTGKLESSSNCVRPMDAAEAALLSETIERELFQATHRLVGMRYKQSVRRLVFTLKHQDKVRRKFLAGKLTAGDIVKSYTVEG